MHEFSLCQRLLTQLQQLLPTDDIDNDPAVGSAKFSIRSITVKLGPYAGIDRDGLLRAFPLAAADSRAAKATLLIESLPLEITCNDCQADYTGTPDHLTCPACGSHSITLHNGDEILITSVQTTTNACP